MAFLKLPSNDPGADDLADWAELCCLFGGVPTISFAGVGDFLQEELGLDDTEDFALGGSGAAGGAIDDALETELRMDAGEAAAEGLDPLGQQVELTFRQLSYRKQIVGPRYPLDITASGATRPSSWAERPFYPFLCLLGARIIYGLDWPVQEPARLFERVVTEAIRRYLNGDAQAVRFGWPRLPDEPVRTFPDKVRTLARRMGEEVGRMRNVGPLAKDYDLDVIAWRPFRDGKTPGQVVVVCQCAIGQDWADKLLSISSWQEVITFNVPPVGALAFPIIPSRDPSLLFRWHDVASKGSIPLDRLRLASLLDEDDAPAALLDDLRAWIGQKVGDLPLID